MGTTKHKKPQEKTAAKAPANSPAKKEVATAPQPPATEQSICTGTNKNSKSKEPTIRERNLELLDSAYGRQTLEAYKKDNAQQVEYRPDAKEWFDSIDWTKLWQEFLGRSEDGRWQHKSVKYLANQKFKTKKEQRWLYLAVGSKAAVDSMNGNRATREVPYLGDWATIRASLMVGEMDKQSILFGNPRVQAVRDAVKNTVSVLESLEKVADVVVEWLGRWSRFAEQVDKYFDYTLADKTMPPSELAARFDLYMEMQDKLFRASIATVREILRCKGVGENDIHLLTQVMLAQVKTDMNGQEVSALSLVNGAANKGKQLAAPVLTSDGQEMQKVNGDVAQSPTLSLLLGTFVQKSRTYNMPHPDIELEGVDSDEDDSTEPHRTVPIRTNGAKTKVH